MSARTRIHKQLGASRARKPRRIIALRGSRIPRRSAVIAVENASRFRGRLKVVYVSADKRRTRRSARSESRHARVKLQETVTAPAHYGVAAVPEKTGTPEVSASTDLLTVAKGARARREIAELDLKRLIKKAGATGLRQRDLAAALGISQPAVSQLKKSAQRVPETVEGFSGATPGEIAARYAAGEIGREQVINELARWDYPPVAPPVEPYDDLYVEDAGGWSDVELAYDKGFLDDGIVDAVQERKWPVF